MHAGAAPSNKAVPCGLPGCERRLAFKAEGQQLLPANTTAALAIDAFAARALWGGHGRSRLAHFSGRGLEHAAGQQHAASQSQAERVATHTA